MKLTLLRAAAVAVAVVALPVAPAMAEDPAAVAVADAASPSELEELLAPLQQDRVWRNSEVGLHVVRVSDGATVFTRDGDVPRVPASTMKIVTAAAALDALGPSYRFTTDVLTDGPIDAAGVLHGNLYIKGTGDPSMVIEEMWRLVADIKLEGVERVGGDLVFDEDFFGPEHHMVGWDKPEDLALGPSYFPELSALSVNFNTAAVVVGPGLEVGGPAKAVLETPIRGDLIEIDNQAVTGAAGSRRRLVVEREVDGAKMKLIVTGSIPADDRPTRSYRAVPDPTAYYIAVFRQLLQTHGVQVSGRARQGSTPRAAELLLQKRSPPLSTLLGDMSKYSNNFYAEQILRAVGAESHGLPGTTESGLQVVHAYLDGLGVAPEDGALVNGSGLSRESRLKPSLLTAVLVDMAEDWQVGHEFVASLAIGGRDGTLWRRLRDDPGRLRGKTGTLDGVHCLTGYLTDAAGELYAFAFLVNDLEGGTSGARRLHDRFARSVLDVGADTALVADGDVP